MEAATLTAGMQIGGSILGAAGTFGEAKALRAHGKYAHQTAAFQAQQLDQKALEAEAIGQRAAYEERKSAEILKSRIQAVAAASGGGAGDVTVENLVGGAKEEGEYRARVAMYESAIAAQDMRLQAEALRRGGAATEGLYKTASRSKRIGAAAGILTEGASLYSKYGLPSAPEYEFYGSYVGDWGYSWT